MGIFRRFTSRSFKYATAMVFTLSLYAGVAGSIQPVRAEGPADPAPSLLRKWSMRTLVKKCCLIIHMDRQLAQQIG